MSEFRIARGTHVPTLDDIREAYSVKDDGDHHTFTVNVSAENIDRTFAWLSAKIVMPCFLFFEVPYSKVIEDAVRQSEDDPLHKDVYYLDNLGFSDAFSIYSKYKDLLVNDGEIVFGIGSAPSVGTDEIIVGAYKIFNIITEYPEKYSSVLSELNFPHTDSLKTVWDTFTPETPGARMILKQDGIDIYGMIEALKEEGLYFAERREQD